MAFAMQTFIVGGDHPELHGSERIVSYVLRGGRLIFQPPSALREVLNETIFSGKSGRGFKPDGELYRVAWALHSGGSAATDKSGNGRGAGINIYDPGSRRGLIGYVRKCEAVTIL